MNDDLLVRLALLDPVDDLETYADAAASADVVRARVDAAPPPASPGRWVRSRRVQAVLAACLAIALLAVALTAIRHPRTGPGTITEDGWLDVGSLADVRAAGVTYVPGAEAFVVARPGEDPYALSAISPHSAYGYEELLSYCRPSGTFVEPAHGDKYDVTGQYAVGPSPSGMYRVPLRIADGEVEVDPSTLLAGAPRGSGPLVDYTTCPANATWSEQGFLDVGGPGNDLAEITFFHTAGQDITVGTFVSSVRGTNCGFPVPTWLQVTDPLGSEPASDADWRYYVADPEGVWANIESSTYSQTDPLPATAEFTGYRSRLFELWADPARAAEEVWIVRRDPNGGTVTERWPRVKPMPACTPGQGSVVPAPSQGQIGLSPAPEGAALTASIRADNLTFDTDTIVLAATTPSTLVLANYDPDVPHNVSIYPDGDREHPVFQGELIVGPAKIEYEIPALTAGVYLFRCDVHPNTMAGTVTVR